MGKLTATDLDGLLEGGCAKCGSKRFEFQTYVAEVLPVQGGEPVGKAKWAYDGEAFLEGVYGVTCSDCSHPQVRCPECPSCGAADGLAHALESENSYPAPEACSACGASDLSFFAMVPAQVSWRDGRSDKAKTDTAPEDPGFHGYRADCRSCGRIVKAESGCPLCGNHCERS
ncbi:MAG: hypothetical protein JNK04_06500 [Myxococcales bacterium]|nr:hypothetical protein [Myxococcales bacterium]